VHRAVQKFVASGLVSSCAFVLWSLEDLHNTHVRLPAWDNASGPPCQRDYVPRDVTNDCRPHRKHRPHRRHRTNRRHR